MFTIDSRNREIASGDASSAEPLAFAPLGRYGDALREAFLALDAELLTPAGAEAIAMLDADFAAAASDAGSDDLDDETLAALAGQGEDDDEDEEEEEEEEDEEEEDEEEEEEEEDEEEEDEEEEEEEEEEDEGLSVRNSVMFGAATGIIAGCTAMVGPCLALYFAGNDCRSHT